jgi:hypothetical protein
MHGDLCRPDFGRAEKRHYVVFKGRRIGAFYAFWYVIRMIQFRNIVCADHEVPRADVEPFVKDPATKKKFRGAWWKRAGSTEEAERLFTEAQSRGEVSVLT